MLFWFCLFEGGLLFHCQGCGSCWFYFLNMYTRWCEEGRCRGGCFVLCFASADVRNSGKSHGHTPLLSCIPRMCGTLVVPKIMKQRLTSLKTHRVCLGKFLNQKERLFAFVDSGCLSFSLININRPGESFRQDRIFLLAELHRRYCHGGYHYQVE